MLVLSRQKDEGVWIGDLTGLDGRRQPFDAVVSLCRLGKAQSPAPGIDVKDHLRLWLQINGVAGCV